MYTNIRRLPTHTFFFLQKPQQHIFSHSHSRPDKREISRSQQRSIIPCLSSTRREKRLTIPPPPSGQSSKSSKDILAFYRDIDREKREGRRRGGGRTGSWTRHIFMHVFARLPRCATYTAIFLPLNRCKRAHPPVLGACSVAHLWLHAHQKILPDPARASILPDKYLHMGLQGNFLKTRTPARPAPPPSPLSPLPPFCRSDPVISFSYIGALLVCVCVSNPSFPSNVRQEIV